MTQPSKLIRLTPEKLSRLRELLRAEGLAPASTTIPRRPASAPVPVSFAQQRILDQADPAHHAYNCPFAFYLDGPLDVDAVARSLREIVARHDAWRSSFVQSGSEFLQQIADAADVPLPVTDLRGLPESEQRTETSRLATGHSTARFDLARGPLLRTRLLRIRDDRHALLLVVHHIISDGWGTGVFIREFSALYTAFAAGRPSPLSALPVEYADYAVWQRRQLSGEALEKMLAHWEERLRDVPVLALPADRPRPADQSYRGSAMPVNFPQAVSERIAALARQEGVSLFMMLLAAFQATLYLHTGQEDIVVGTPIANRTQVELEPLLGCFINLLAMRTDLAGNPTFLELTARVRDVCLDAYAHQSCPFSELAKRLHPAEDRSRHPLFQVMLELVNTPTNTRLTLPGLTLSQLDFVHGTSEFDINLILGETGRGLTGWILYKTDLRDASTIQRLLRDLQAVLEAVTENPGVRLRDLLLLLDR
jgi:hypothetical protein